MGRRHYFGNARRGSFSTDSARVVGWKMSASFRKRRSRARAGALRLAGRLMANVRWIEHRMQMKALHRRRIKDR
jgi:hypothetical protein